MPSCPAGEGAGLQKTPLLTESHNIPYIVLPALNGKVNMVHPLVEYQLGAFQGPESAEHQFGAADVVLGPAHHNGGDSDAAQHLGKLLLCLNFCKGFPGIENSGLGGHVGPKLHSLLYRFFGLSRR